ncbi:hypothetical protein K6119_18350 [Paracrocinitomix mangrovi]|uniref:hypothetical protein n=1 Tax=Paracrocinitomix mangrovi TaxID=2862509 RepID=UPI001C8DA3C3|nr:hypothetical protein [Paracrocinitomix mangrovi]UKN01688.1 hypothetical protein K6119_18350 [Paracrocinitomix mangrovi]
MKKALFAFALTAMAATYTANSFAQDGKKETTKTEKKCSDKKKSCCDKKKTCCEKKK